MTNYDKDVDWVGIAKDKELSGLGIRSYYRSGRLQTFVAAGTPMPSMQTFFRRMRYLGGLSDSLSASAATGTDRAIPVYSFTEQQVQSALQVRANVPVAAKHSEAASGRRQVRVRLPRDVSVEIDCDDPERFLLKTLLLVLPS